MPKYQEHFTKIIPKTFDCMKPIILRKIQLARYCSGKQIDTIQIICSVTQSSVLLNEIICATEYSISGADKSISHTDKAPRKAQWHNHLKDLLDVRKQTGTYEEWVRHTALVCPFLKNS